MAEQQTLFGPSPEELQMAIQQQREKQMLGVAQLNPYQQVQYQAGLAGANAGDAITDSASSMVGRELNPMKQKPLKIKEAVEEVRLKGIDPNKPDEMYGALADAFQKRGLTEEALQASLRRASFISDAETKAATISKLKAEALAKTREKESNVQTLQRERDRALINGEPEKANELHRAITKATTGDYEKIEEGVKDANGNVVEGMMRQVLVKKDDPSDRIEFAPYKKGALVNIEQNADKASDAAFADTYKNASKEFNTKRSILESSKANFLQLESFLNGNPKLTTGTFADARNEILRGLVTIGMLGKEEAKTVENNDLVDILLGSQVLKNMQLLSGSDSNEELRKISQITGSRRNDPAIIKKVIEAFKRDLTRYESAQRAFENWTGAGGNPIYWNFADARPMSAGGKPGDLKWVKEKNPDYSPTNVPRAFSEVSVTASERDRAREFYKSQGLNPSDDEIDEKIKKSKAK